MSHAHTHSMFEEVLQLKGSFGKILCSHIYRERNSMANEPNKLGAQQDRGTW